MGNCMGTASLVDHNVACKYTRPSREQPPSSYSISYQLFRTDPRRTRLLPRETLDPVAMAGWLLELRGGDAGRSCLVRSLGF
jgi:hypothetical protein